MCPCDRHISGRWVRPIRPTSNLVHRTNLVMDEQNRLKNKALSNVHLSHARARMHVRVRARVCASVGVGAHTRTRAGAHMLDVGRIVDKYLTHKGILLVHQLVHQAK